MKKNLLLENAVNESDNYFFALSFYEQLKKIEFLFMNFLDQFPECETVIDQKIYLDIDKCFKALTIRIRLINRRLEPNQIMIKGYNLKGIYFIFFDFKNIFENINKSFLDKGDYYGLYFEAVLDLFECYLKNANLISRS